MGIKTAEHVLFGRVFFVALYHLAYALNAALDHFHIGENELELNGLNIPFGIDAALNVDNIVVFEAPYNVNNGVDLAYVRQKFIAEPLAL